MFVYGPLTAGDSSESETDSQCDPEVLLMVTYLVAVNHLTLSYLLNVNDVIYIMISETPRRMRAKSPTWRDGPTLRICLSTSNRRDRIKQARINGLCIRGKYGEIK